jgi:DNA-binding SARP family transcriptional activator
MAGARRLSARVGGCLATREAGGQNGRVPGQAHPEQASDHGRRWAFQVLGPFTVWRDGSRVASADIGSKKGRTLLKLLILERGRTVSVDQIADVLWEGAERGSPERDVATLVSRLRGVLGTDAIEGGPHGYRFVPAPGREIDLNEAIRLAAAAEVKLAAGEPGLAKSAADRAAAILGSGEVLEDEPSAPWLDGARTAATRLRRRARRSQWKAALELGDLDAASAAAQEAMAADPLDEEACRAQMAALDRAGAPGEALAAYQRLREVLADELGADPAPETTALHLSILRGERGAATAVAQPPRPVAAAGRAWARHVFVGREAEVALLTSWWAKAADGRQSFALIEGEPGIGKSSLARELAEVATDTGGVVLRSRCYEMERSLFLEPFADAIRGVVVSSPPDLVRELAGRWAPTLAELIPEVGAMLRPARTVPAPPEIERRRAFEAMLAAVRSLAHKQPALLFLDDLHNAAASTIELLHFMLRRTPRDRLMVVATARTGLEAGPSQSMPEPTVRIELGPLSGEAVRQLAVRLRAPGAADRVFARTRGHPLFVVESLRAFTEAGSAGPGWPIPASLQSAVLARVGRAGHEVGELLSAAATLGVAFEPQALADLAELPLEEVARRADRATKARLLVEAGNSFEFANDLIQEIVYRTTPLPIRTARHRRAARLVTDPEAVARHAHAAEDWPAAAAAWLRAAERAAATYSNRDAESLLDRALDAAAKARDPSREAAARLARGRAREALADYQGAFADHSEAVRLAREMGDRVTEMHTLRELGGDLVPGLGRPARECIPPLENGLLVAEELGDDAARVDLLARMAIIWTNALRFDLGHERAAQAVEIARRTQDQATLAVALDGAKNVAAYSWDIAGLERVLRELEPMLRRQGNLKLLQWTLFEASFVPMARGDWDRATRGIEAALEINRRAGYRAYEALFVSHLAWIERMRGGYGKAMHLAGQAIEQAQETGHPWWIAFAEAVAGATLIEMFAPDEAVPHLERGLAAAEGNKTEAYLLGCTAHLAHALQILGDRERSRQMLSRAEAILATVRTPAGSRYMRGAEVIAAVARTRLLMGDPDAAEALAGLIGPPDRAEPAVAVATAAHISGLCGLTRGDLSGARQHLETALTVAESIGLASVAWRSCASLAWVCEQQGQVREATHHTETARAQVAAIAATIGDLRLRRGFEDRAYCAYDAG